MNQQVRTARAADGGFVILAAYCPTCQAEGTPDRNGRCSFCGTPIIDEDQLSTKDALAALDGPVDAQTAESNGHAEPATIEIPPSRPAGRGAKRPKYSRDQVEQALRHFHDEHGRPPAFADINECDYLPRPAGAVLWRQVAADLGWPDPGGPKRITRRTSALTQPVQAETASGSTTSAQGAAVGFTVDELWLLHRKVAAELDARDHASTVAMADAGAGPWRALERKLRLAIEAQR